MKNINKIEILKMIKTKIAPIAVSVGVTSYVSGCQIKVERYSERWAESNKTSMQLTQTVYENIDRLKIYNYIDEKASLIGEKWYVGVGKLVNGEMEYGFIDGNFKEVIPIGKYTSINTGTKSFYNANGDLIVSLICVENKSDKGIYYGYIDPNTLEEVIPLDEWKKIVTVGNNIIKAERKDGTFETYNFKKEQNKTLTK